MTLIDKIKNELEKRFAQNGYTTLTLTMKTDGTSITITPCIMWGDTTAINDCEYFIVECETIPGWMGEESIQRLSEKLADYNTLLESHKKETELLAKLEKRLKNPKPETTYEQWQDDYQFFSDWSKSVYGRRIRVKCPIPA